MSAPLEAKMIDRHKKPDFYHGSNKLGNASVHPVNVTPIDCINKSTAAQNIIEMTSEFLRGNDGNVQVVADGIRVRGFLTLPHRGTDMPNSIVHTDF